MGWGERETMIDWDDTGENRRENRGMRDGWRAEEKRRDQHGTNCFPCTPAEP